jgi:hypothetical protein
VTIGVHDMWRFVERRMLSEVATLIAGNEVWGSFPKHGNLQLRERSWRNSWVCDQLFSNDVAAVFSTAPRGPGPWARPRPGVDGQELDRMGFPVSSQSRDAVQALRTMTVARTCSEYFYSGNRTRKSAASCAAATSTGSSKKCLVMLRGWSNLDENCKASRVHADGVCKDRPFAPGGCVTLTSVAP